MTTLGPTIKVVLIGKTFAGKTCLCSRYMHKSFSQSNSNTVGAAYGALYKPYDGEKIKLEIWDTAGSERYESWLPLYMRQSTAALICYDLTNYSHWLKAKEYVSDVKQRVPGCRIYLVGTKLDIIQKEGVDMRKVTLSEAQTYCEAERLEAVTETSSLTGYNVCELVERVFSDCAPGAIKVYRMASSTSATGRSRSIFRLSLCSHSSGSLGVTSSPQQKSDTGSASGSARYSKCC